MTAVYVVLVVGGLEILDLLVPATSVPGWASPLILSIAIAGLPTVVVLAWTFDITPEGVVRTGELEQEGLGAEGKENSGHDQAAWPGTTHDRAIRPGTAPPTHRAADPDAPGAPGPPSQGLNPLAVAVLPFDNLSGAAEAEPFAMGLHDDLLTELSRASALTVISRTSVRAYRDTEKSLRQVAQELGAGTIVEGGVQRAGNRVRLNVQLIDARSDAHLWAERYDRELTAETMFDLQSELAASIMGALEAQLTSAEQARSHERPTDDLEAYRLYALGRERFVDRSRERMEEAVGFFERAIDRDPDYANAWAGLGMALVALVDYGHVEAPELVERGRKASFRALELAPDLAEAHAAVGNLHGYLQNGPAALEFFAGAMRLGPGLSLGYQWASWIHLNMGDPRSALPAALRATQLDPLEPEARGNLALAYLALDNGDQAEAEASRTLETHPCFGYCRLVLAMALHGRGADDEALSVLEGVEEPQFQAWAELSEGIGLLAAGRRDAARAIAGRLEGDDALFEAGVLTSAIGDVEAGIRLVRGAAPLFWDEALALRYWTIPALDHLRQHDGFDDLLAELDRSWGVSGDRYAS